MNLTKQQCTRFWLDYRNTIRAADEANEARRAGFSFDPWANMKAKTAASYYLQFCRAFYLDIAESHDWTLAKSNYFEWGELKRCKWPCLDLLRVPLVDHAVGFRDSARPHKPAAILSHSLIPAPLLPEYLARLKGYTCEVLPWSCYYPDHATAVLIILNHNKQDTARRIPGAAGYAREGLASDFSMWPSKGPNSRPR